MYKRNNSKWVKVGQTHFLTGNSLQDIDITKWVMLSGEKEQNRHTLYPLYTPSPVLYVRQDPSDYLPGKDLEPLL